MADDHRHAELTELLITASQDTVQDEQKREVITNRNAAPEQVGGQRIVDVGYELELSDQTVVQCMDDTDTREVVAE